MTDLQQNMTDLQQIMTELKQIMTNLQQIMTNLQQIVTDLQFKWLFHQERFFNSIQEESFKCFQEQSQD